MTKCHIKFLCFLFLSNTLILKAEYTEYTDLFFIDKEVGWVIGRSTHISNRNFIAKTVSGGDEWEFIFPEIFDIHSKPYRFVYFLNQQTGWIGLDANELFQTSDGGYTWHLINDNIYPDGFCFINEQIGWCTTYRGSSPVINKTIDGGVTWIPDTMFADLQHPLYSIDFIDSLNGVAVGGGLSGTTDYVALTNDGGVSWNMNACPGNPPLYDVEYFAEDMIWAVGGWLGLGIIYHSDNKAEDPWSAQYYSDYDPIYKIQFVDSLIGWAGGREIVRTRNGGVNWEPVYLFPNDYCRSFDLCAVDSLEAWCIYNDTLYHTLDGGYNWEQPQIVSSVEPVLEVLDDFKFYIYPNPFNQSTAVYYNVPESADDQNVRLELYNTAGQRVRVLLDKTMPSGEYWMLWNGTDERGAPVASGVYILNLMAKDVTIARKMTLAR